MQRQAAANEAALGYVGEESGSWRNTRYIRVKVLSRGCQGKNSRWKALLTACWSAEAWLHWTRVIHPQPGWNVRALFAGCLAALPGPLTHSLAHTVLGWGWECLSHGAPTAQSNISTRGNSLSRVTYTHTLYLLRLKYRLIFSKRLIITHKCKLVWIGTFPTAVSMQDN